MQQNLCIHVHKYVEISLFVYRVQYERHMHYDYIFIKNIAFYIVWFETNQENPSGLTADFLHFVLLRIHCTSVI